MLPDLQSKLTAFELQSEIARTEFTVMLTARRVADGASVLLVVLQPNIPFDAYFARLFKDMGARHQTLDHPHILKILSVEEENGLLYTVFDFPGGELLSDYLSRHAPLPPTDVVPLVRQVSTALDYAHSRGVRHGSLSANNIFIHQNQVYLVQFGLAQLLEDNSLFETSASFADPRFMAPERLRGESPSRTTDLYALGVLAYLLLTGEYPFAADDESAHRTPPAPPHTLVAAVRPALSEVVLRMLSKGVELRHSTGAEFARALQVAAEGSAPLRPITAAMMAVKPEKRPASPRVSPRAVLVGLVIVLVAMLALGGGFWLITRTETLSQWFASSTPPTATPLPVRPTAPPPTVAEVNIPSPQIATPTVAPTPSPTPEQTPHATATPTLPVEGAFSKLVLAEGITDDYKPLRPASVFSTTTKSVYLFFHYEGIAPDTTWQVEWRYNGSTVQTGTDAWNPDYGSVGTAWVFYAPIDGFSVGNYSVSLGIEGTVIAETSFEVR